MNSGYVTHVGQVRQDNQDSVYVMTAGGDDTLPDFHLLIVADGMGGHEDGKAASMMAVRAVVEEVTRQVYLPLMTQTNILPLTEVMNNALEKANSEIRKQSPGSGTTCTAIALMSGRAYIAHVGDSRAYLLHNGEIEQITTDHSVVQRLVSVGQLTPEEAVDHPRSNELYRSLGLTMTVEVDTLTRRLPDGAGLLLCSDGLWNLVSDDDLLRVISAEANAQAACDALVARANAAGGGDNISVILMMA